MPISFCFIFFSSVSIFFQYFFNIFAKYFDTAHTHVFLRTPFSQSNISTKILLDVFTVRMIFSYLYFFNLVSKKFFLRKNINEITQNVYLLPKEINSKFLADITLLICQKCWFLEMISDVIFRNSISNNEKSVKKNKK